MALLGASFELTDFDPTLHDRFFEIAELSQMDANHGIELVGGQRMTLGDVVGVKDPKAVSHREKLKNHIGSVLLPAIKKLSYVPLEQPVK